MKYLAILTALILPACSTLEAWQANPTVQTYEKAALEAAGLALGVPPGVTAAAILASQELYGIAAHSQAHVGKTPQEANVAQGAATAVVGNSVQLALPPAPITQETVNQLYAAAKNLAK